MQAANARIRSPHRRNADPLLLLVFPNKLDEVDSIYAFVSVDAQGREAWSGWTRPWVRRRRSPPMHDRSSESSR